MQNMVLGSTIQEDNVVVLAYYKKTKIWLQVAFVAGLIVFALYVTLFSYGGHPIARALSSPRRIFLIPAIGLTWICAAFVFLRMLFVIRQLLFEGGRAVWIDNETLVVLSKIFFTVKIREICEISKRRLKADTFVSYDAIVLKLRGGNEKNIAIGSFRESCQAIIDKLSAEIAKVK